MNQCFLCGEQVEYDRCDYCGLIFIETDGDISDKIRRDIDAYRQKVIDKISEIGFISVQPLFDKTENVKIVWIPVIKNDDFRSFDITWFTNKIASGESVTIYVKMSNDTTKQFNVEFKEIPEFKTIKLGMRLNKNLKLDIYYRKPSDTKLYIVSENTKLGANVLK